MFCKNCGAEIAEGTAFCTSCGARQEQPAPAPQSVPATPRVDPTQIPKKENVLLGTVGAILGALVGALAILIFYNLEMVASISGVILAAAVFFGYDKLGGNRTVIGTIICLALIIVTPYISYLFYLTRMAQDAMGSSLGEAYEFLKALMETSDMKDAMMENLLPLYGFTALGAIGIIVSKFSAKKPKKA